MAEFEEVESGIQLLVEGNDQRNFFEAFRKHLSLDNIRIRSYGGGPDLREYLKGFVKIDGFDTIQTLGVVRDAENSAENTFRSVQGSLRSCLKSNAYRSEGPKKTTEKQSEPSSARHNSYQLRRFALSITLFKQALRDVDLTVPAHPALRSGNKPAVNVLILPDNSRPGMLETLLCETFAGTPRDTCIEAFFDCISAIDVEAVKRLDKARAWAYLTTKPDPHHSVGFATTKGYWGDLDQPVFNGIRNFLSSL